MCKNNCKDYHCKDNIRFKIYTFRFSWNEK
jgi:hypothetical protein